MSNVVRARVKHIATNTSMSSLRDGGHPVASATFVPEMEIYKGEIEEFVREGETDFYSHVESGYTFHKDWLEIIPAKKVVTVNDEVLTPIELPESETFLSMETLPFTASEFLDRSSALLKERGKDYDAEEERSMAKTVKAFEVITGKALSEPEGWLFMQILKDVRQWTGDSFHRDSAEDCIAYAALKAEALAKDGKPS